MAAAVAVVSTQVENAKAALNLVKVASLRTCIWGPAAHPVDAILAGSSQLHGYATSLWALLANEHHASAASCQSRA